MKTAEEIIKKRYPFYNPDIAQKDIEINGEAVIYLMEEYASQFKQELPTKQELRIVISNYAAKNSFNNSAVIASHLTGLSETILELIKSKQKMKVLIIGNSGVGKVATTVHQLIEHKEIIEREISVAKQELPFKSPPMLPMIDFGEYKSGKQNRRERRAKERKNKNR